MDKYKEKLISQIKIIDANLEDYKRIKNVLRKNKNEIIKRIKFIKVYNQSRIPPYI